MRPLASIVERSLSLHLRAYAAFHKDSAAHLDAVRGAQAAFSALREMNTAQVTMHAAASGAGINDAGAGYMSPPYLHSGNAPRSAHVVRPSLKGTLRRCTQAACISALLMHPVQYPTTGGARSAYFSKPPVSWSPATPGSAALAGTPASATARVHGIAPAPYNAEATGAHERGTADSVAAQALDVHVPKAVSQGTSSGTASGIGVQASTANGAASRTGTGITASRVEELLERYSPPARGRTVLTPVLMYHMIGGSEDRFTVSPARLRSHLDTLRLRGYRLVTFREYAAGKYAAYAARAPPVAVITFDDSTRCQFNMLPDGKIDPDSAVGVLEEYKERHPEYPVTATFFVNTTTLNRTVAFEQEGLEGRKLRFLVQHGYEVGAHGDRHRSFRSLAPDEIRADLDIFSRRMQEYLPEYTIKSFAYPFGSIPDARRQRVVQEYFPYTAHAWGGIAHGQYLNAPRIETGPATILAQYLSPTARLRPGMGNVYKGEQNLMSYARSHP